MRMGKVQFIVDYVVDLDNADQIEIAKDFISEDVEDIVRYHQINDWFDLVEDPNLSYSDIHTGILELSGCSDDEDDDE